MEQLCYGAVKLWHVIVSNWWERIGMIMQRGWKDERFIREYVERVYPREKKEKKIQEIQKQQRKLWVILLGIMILVILYSLFSESESSLIQKENQITRQEKDAALTLEVTASKDGKEWKKDMTIEVDKRNFTEEEKKGLEQQTENYLSQNFQGENVSLSAVNRPLVMKQSIPDTEIALAWNFDEEYIREDGTLIASAIPKEGIDTEIRVKAICRNWKKTFTFALHLLPVEISKEQQISNQVKNAVKDALKSQSTKKVVTLPEQIGNLEIQYKEKEEKSYGLIFIMLLVCGCMPFALREQQKKKLAVREEQMMADYPGIVNKIMLLLGAGLTLRKSVERLTTEYERDRKQGGELRYAYEELCIMNQEMRDGISEGQAMEHFGKRCRLLPYLRFASIITQNLKKGAEGIIDILEKESMEALEQRKERVLQMGEKAGTKLLFPMMIMLGLVMGIIMIPAFMTM